MYQPKGLKMEPQISKIHTPCKYCVFAIYDENTQTDCAIKELNYYRQHGAEIIEVYDNDKEFYVINGYRCLYHRNHNWAATKTEPYLEHIYEEIKMRYQAIVVANQSLVDIEITVQSLANQELPPIHISVIRPKHSIISPRQITELLQTTGIEWRVENMMNPNLKIENHIDIIIDFVPKPNYAVFQAGFIVPAQTFSYINDKIIKRELSYFTLLPNDGGNGFITSYYLHKNFQGNKGYSLIEKLKEDEKCSKLIQPIYEVLPFFPK